RLPRVAARGRLPMADDADRGAVTRIGDARAATTRLNGRAAMLRIERHQQGPRLYACGRRVHEWHCGVAVVAATAAMLALEAATISLWTLGAFVLGAWLIAKDWRDIPARSRDTASWRVGLHVRFAPLRALRYSDGLP